jgi:hypothetical protein
MDVVERGGIGIAGRKVGKVEVGYADGGAVTLIVALRDDGVFVEAVKHVVRDNGFERFPDERVSIYAGYSKLSEKTSDRPGIPGTTQVPSKEVDRILSVLCRHI